MMSNLNQVPGSAYCVEKDGARWVLHPLTDAAGLIMVDVQTPPHFRTKKEACEWVRDWLMPHPDGRYPPRVATAPPWRRVTKAATRSHSELIDWVVPTWQGAVVTNELFGEDEASARRFYEAHKEVR